MEGSFLALGGLHVLVTGSSGGIGGEAVREFLGESIMLLYELN